MRKYNFIFMSVVILVATVTMAVTFGSRRGFEKGTKQVEPVPQLLNYQGRLTDPNTGAPVVDGNYNITFSIYNVNTGGTALWSETNTVTVSKGFFNILLGNTNPVPVTLFDGSERWFGIKVETNPEMVPRQQIATVAYAFKAARGSRDLYHDIIDVSPNSTTKFYVYPRYENSRVTLYLHGEAFNAALAEHTHSGNNAHSHTFSGTTNDKSIAHTHSVSISGNTGNWSGSTGSWSGNTGNWSGTTGGKSLSYSGNTATDGSHRHDLRVDGTPGSGVYLVEAGEVNGLSSSMTVDRTCTGSVATGQSSHKHAFSFNLGSHTHSIPSHKHSIPSHSHSIPSHKHSFSWSGNTGSNSITHNHGFSGTTDAAGAGLSTEGVANSVYPTNVSVYVDGALADGPYSGNFSSGAIDLSAYITDNSEHYIEIKEEGGTGGRIIYDLFVE